MEESNSHHHGNKKKPITNKFPSSKSDSERVHLYSSQDTPTRNDKTKKSASMDRDVESKSAKNYNTYSIRDNSEKVGQKSKSNDTKTPKSVSESSQAVRSRKYGTWDKNAKYTHKGNSKPKQAIDDSVVGKTAQNDFEGNKVSKKMQRSKSTDISSLRHKSKSRSKSSSTGQSPFEDVSHNHLLYESFPKVHSYNKAESITVSNHSPDSTTASLLSDFRSFPRHKKSVRPNSIGLKSKDYEIPPRDIEDSLHTESYLDNMEISDNQVSIDMASILPNSDEADDNFEFPTCEGYRRHGLKHSFPSAPFHRIKRFGSENICKEFLGVIIFSVCAFFIFCPVAALSIILIPFSFLLKKMCSCCCYGNQCECGHLLTNKEKILFHHYPSSIYQSVLFMEYGLSTVRIRDIIHSRLVSACDKNGYKLYPKFTHKIQPSCKGPAWVHDSGFFMNNHVYNIPSSVENLEDLQEYIGEMASRPLSNDRPLWEMQVLNNFGDQRDTVILFRIHPCVYDGVSLVRILFKSLVDMDTVTCAIPRFSNRDRCLNTIKGLFTGPLVFFKNLLCIKQDFNMLHGQHIHLSGKKVISWSEPFTVEDATRIRQVTRSTLNDILLSVAAGCLRKYFCLNGIAHPYDLHTVMPVFYNSGNSVYPLDNNHFLFMRVPLPTNTEGTIPRLWQMKQIMKKIHQQALFSVTRVALSVTSCILPLNLQYKLWNFINNKCSCIISNIAGPALNLTFASRQIKSIIPWMPPLDHLAVSITFFTYGDQIRMSLMTDRSVLPNPELLTNEFNNQMQNLSELLANRRLPGEVLTQKLEQLQQDCEIHAEPTVEQLQAKMTLIQQEVHDLKIQLESDGRRKSSGGETKLIKKIESLKEQFRELLVEIRQRKAAESENAMILLSEDDPDFEDDNEDSEPRRPFRRRTLSVSSRMSTASVSSTARPLAASPITPPSDFPVDFDNISQTSSRPDGITPVGGRPQRRQNQAGFQILDYSYSPSLERRFRTY